MGGMYAVIVVTATALNARQLDRHAIAELTCFVVDANASPEMLADT